MFSWMTKEIFKVSPQSSIDTSSFGVINLFTSSTRLCTICPTCVKNRRNCQNLLLMIICETLDGKTTYKTSHTKYHRIIPMHFPKVVLFYVLYWHCFPKYNLMYDDWFIDAKKSGCVSEVWLTRYCNSIKR